MIDLLPTPEQEAIAASVRAVLERDWTWADAVAQGWFGLGLAEADGGVGCGLAEEALVATELGRRLAPPALLATTVAAHVAATAGAADLRDALVAGEARAAPARWRAGEPALVLDAAGATHALVVDARGARIHAVPARTPATWPAVDPGVTIASMPVDGPPVVHVEGEGPWQRMLVLVAAALSGQAAEARDLAVRHACEREQFGRPIGVHQAVKHPIADMAVRCEAAGAQVAMAALVAGAGAPEAQQEAVAAALVALDAAFANSRACVQVHGGIGFTDEHPAHRLVKRTHVLDRLLGGSAALARHLVGASAGAGAGA